MLERIVEFDPAIDVILMTAHYTTETAVEAIQKGACDYLNKPVSIPALRKRVEKLLVDARQWQRALDLDRELLETCRFEGMIGRSPLMWDLFARIRRVAQTLSFGSYYRANWNRERSGGEGAAQFESRERGPFCNLQLFGGGGNSV